MPFEASHPFTPTLLRGRIEAAVVEIGGIEPTNIIRNDQDFEVQLTWTLEGTLTPFVCGAWCVAVHLESIGAGAEFKLPVDALHLPLDPAPGAQEYRAWVRIPAGSVPADLCGTAYKLVSTVTYLTPKGQPGPMAGYVEGPIVFVYPVLV
jgi:hypothetical protein